MKVRLFDDQDYKTIEKRINIWLRANPDIEIRFIAQSQEGGDNTSVGIIVITIWYKEEKSEN